MNNSLHRYFKYAAIFFAGLVGMFQPVVMVQALMGTNSTTSVFLFALRVFGGIFEMA